MYCLCTMHVYEIGNSNLSKSRQNKNKTFFSFIFVCSRIPWKYEINFKIWYYHVKSGHKVRWAPCKHTCPWFCLWTAVVDILFNNLCIIASLNVSTQQFTSINNSVDTETQLSTVSNVHIMSIEHWALSNPSSVEDHSNLPHMKLRITEKQMQKD